MVEIKRALRREHLAARRALGPEELAAISAAIVARLRSLPELSTPQRPTLTLLLYSAQPDEVDPAALTLGLPLDARVVLPRVVGDELELVEHRTEARLVRGAFGILEPPRSAELLDPAEIDVAVVPGVAFDVRGGRLGRGGGFYDRLLPRLRPDCVLIGLAPERAVLAAVPTEPHDRPVDLVVTDASVRRRSPTPVGPPA